MLLVSPDSRKPTAMPTGVALAMSSTCGDDEASLFWLNSGMRTGDSAVAQL